MDGETDLRDVEAARANAAQGRALAASVRQGGAREDPHRLDEAIDLLAAGVAGLPPGDTDRAPTSWDLGCLLTLRHLTRRGLPGDVNRAVGVLVEAAASEALSAQQRAVAHLLIGQILVVQAIPDAAAPGYQAAAQQMMGGATFDLAMLNTLGRIVTGADDPQLMDSFAVAESHISAALDSTALPEQLRGSANGLLAFSRMLQWPHGQAAPDLDGVIDILLGLGEQPGLPSREIEALGRILAAMGGRSDPDAMRKLAQQLPEGHVMSPLLFDDAAREYVRRAEAGGESAALHMALDTFREAIATTDPGHPLVESLAHSAAGGALAAAALNPDPEAAAEVRRIADALREGAEGDPVMAARTGFLTGMAQFLVAMGSGEYAGFGEAVDRLSQAVRDLPEDDPLAPTARHLLAGVLIDRYQMHGAIDDLRQAVGYLAALPALPDGDGVEAPMLLGLRGLARTLLGVRMLDRDLLAQAVADLQESVGRYPEGAFGRARAHTALGMAQLALGGLTGDAALVGAGAARIADAAATMQTDGSDRRGLRARGGMARVLQALFAPDERRVARIDRGIAEIDAAVVETGYLTWERGRLLAALATAYLVRHHVTGEPADLDRAIERYEEAYLAGSTQASAAESRRVLHGLAGAYRLRAGSDVAARRAATEAALAELAAAVADVALQTGSRSALVAARGVADRGLEVAGWCLDGDASEDPAAAAVAVEALELGRGLVLHVATSALGVMEALLASGEPALAAEWSRHLDTLAAAPPSGDGGPASALDLMEAVDLTLAQADNDVRVRVALALGESSAVTPARLEAVAAALQAERADALVYLLPPSAAAAGRALLVRPDGAVTALSLDSFDATRYAWIESYQELLKRADADGRVAWLQALDRLCVWAWRAVMRPVLAAAGADGAAGGGGDPTTPVRVILVPCGRLAAVPWHAAYDENSGRGALDRAIVSYAASAGQFVEASRRGRLDISSAPVLVGNPTFGLLHTRWCVEGLAEEIYPDATAYGSLSVPVRGPGTPAEILTHLPGGAATRIASVIHLGCHADLDPLANPLRSSLQLADGRLSVEQILQHAAARSPTAPSGLVVLGACTSDVTADAFDESLTLTTSMLAAGAYGVVGARWRVRDARTAVLLYAFHHHLAAGSPPAEALRSAQLWARDPGRAAVPRMPDNLREVLAGLDGDPSEPGFAHPYSWAAFAHHGC